MTDESSTLTYVFTKEAVLRAIAKLEEQPIHEHFPGYLAILRARQANQGLPIRLPDITELHDRYLRVVGAPDKSPYVRPFKSRGRGLELYNPNVAGSYGPSSLRAKGALKDVIEVIGENRNASYELKPNHAIVAQKNLLKGRKVPVTALTAFLYRDYGFYLDIPTVSNIVRIFRKEFGISEETEDQKAVFDTLFTDDVHEYKDSDLEIIRRNSL